VVRIVALDLDGTLLDSADRISEANARAVRRAVASGVKVVLATSRWYSLARKTADALELTEPLICHTGGLIRDPTNGHDLLHLRLDLDAARDVAAYCDAHRYRTFMTIDDLTYLRTNRQMDPAQLPPDVRPMPEIAPMLGAAPTALLTFGSEAVDDLLATFSERYEGVLNLCEGYSETFPRYLSISHAQADKGTGLMHVCELMGIDPQDALAMGDAPPDVAMFEVAGHSVAMANAPAHVRDLAESVAPRNDEDGVAWALEQFVL
jgi:Cof subfamily protein (haloacid dehalogenase superfamily)